MPEPFVERRRTSRVTLAAGHSLQLPRASTVQLVDISLGGVLVNSPQPVQLGQRARLQTRLGGGPVDVEVEVRRVAPDWGPTRDGGRFRLGVRFVGIDEATRRHIQRFLREGEA